jgi:hypothetical protein
MSDGSEVRNEIGRFAIVPVTLIDDHAPDFGPVALYALLAGEWADRASNTAFPSRATIARRLGVSIKTTDRWKARLVESGWLRVTRRLSPAGDWTSNLYELRVLPRTPATRGNDTHDATGNPTRVSRTKTTRNQTNATPTRVPTPTVEETMRWLETERHKPNPKTPT